MGEQERPPPSEPTSGRSPAGREGVVLEEPPLIVQVVKEEMAGKHRAIYAYDKIIWRIRVGFVTLFFGGWAIFLTGYLGKNAVAERAEVALIGLLLFSMASALAAFMADTRYRAGKAQVIADLEGFLAALLKQHREEAEKANLPPDATRRLLRISGEQSDATKLRATLFIYGVPPLIALALTATLLLYGSGQTGGG